MKMINTTFLFFFFGGIILRVFIYFRTTKSVEGKVDNEYILLKHKFSPSASSRLLYYFLKGFIILLTVVGVSDCKDNSQKSKT